MMSRSDPARLPSPHDTDVSIEDDAFLPQAVLASINLVSVDLVSVNSMEPTGTAWLHSAERAVACTLAPHRREAYTAGRRALRAALQRIAPDAGAMPLLSTARGAPRLPAGFVGSISHKRTRAIAIVAPDSAYVPGIDGNVIAGAGVNAGVNAGALTDVSDTVFLGLDLEDRPQEDALTRPSIARRILTVHEQAAIAHLAPLPHREATMLRFALKEAVYKAIDPIVHRYVGFTEVELDVHDDGKATVRLLLREFDAALIQIHAHWRAEANYLVAVARAVRRRSDP